MINEKMIRVWESAIERSLPSIDLDNGHKYDEDEPWNDSRYNDLSSAIVEPDIDSDEALEAYCEFMENEPDKWAAWIRKTFGKELGQVAKIVNIVGY